jgi:hypothetical protein
VLFPGIGAGLDIALVKPGFIPDSHRIPGRFHSNDGLYQVSVQAASLGYDVNDEVEAVCSILIFLAHNPLMPPSL